MDRYLKPVPHTVGLVVLDVYARDRVRCGSSTYCLRGARGIARAPLRGC